MAAGPGPRESAFVPWACARPQAPRLCRSAEFRGWRRHNGANTTPSAKPIASGRRTNWAKSRTIWSCGRIRSPGRGHRPPGLQLAFALADGAKVKDQAPRHLQETGRRQQGSGNTPAKPRGQRFKFLPTGCLRGRADGWPRQRTPPDAFLRSRGGPPPKKNPLSDFNQTQQTGGKMAALTRSG